jgi:hypothetical protein
MVNLGQNYSRQCGVLMTEMVVAMAIIVIAVLPLAFLTGYEQKLLRIEYNKAVAMEIVDGEMEVLAAGEWRAFKQGTQPYPVRAAAAKNLLPGRFELTITGKHLRLEWRPDQKGEGGKVVREVTVK